MHSARLSGTIQSNTLGLATMVTQISSATQELAAVSESFKQISGEMSDAMTDTESAITSIIDNTGAQADSTLDMQDKIKRDRRCDRQDRSQCRCPQCFC